ncbi:hypothetical protein R3P38DRAFT_2776470 [Favolaschia claudopus]|uniref:F-box domain-containing protein n=1 Tax=Favolaschia claudopus TaxID=2862362 RepID=A0AAV9YY22_9AGAR
MSNAMLQCSLSGNECRLQQEVVQKLYYLPARNWSLSLGVLAMAAYKKELYRSDPTGYNSIPNELVHRILSLVSEPFDLDPSSCMTDIHRLRSRRVWSLPATEIGNALSGVLSLQELVLQRVTIQYDIGPRVVLSSLTALDISASTCEEVLILKVINMPELLQLVLRLDESPIFDLAAESLNHGPKVQMLALEMESPGLGRMRTFFRTLPRLRRLSVSRSSEQLETTIGMVLLTSADVFPLIERVEFGDELDDELLPSMFGALAARSPQVKLISPISDAWQGYQRQMQCMFLRDGQVWAAVQGDSANACSSGVDRKMDRLPTELVVEIISLALTPVSSAQDVYDNDLLRVRLQRTCKFIRDVVLNTPLFWTFIAVEKPKSSRSFHLSTSLSMITKHLAQSGLRLLHVAFELPLLRVSNGEDLYVRSWNELLRNSGRWQSLFLRAPSFCSATERCAAAIVRGDTLNGAVNLQCLDVQKADEDFSECWMHHQPMRLVSNMLQKVECAVLSVVDFTPSHLLASLDVSTDSDINWSTFLRPIETLLCLRTLTLRSVGFPPPIHAPNLNTLEVLDRAIPINIQVITALVGLHPASLKNLLLSANPTPNISLIPIVNHLESLEVFTASVFQTRTAVYKALATRLLSQYIMNRLQRLKEFAFDAAPALNLRSQQARNRYAILRDLCVSSDDNHFKAYIAGITLVVQNFPRALTKEQVEAYMWTQTGFFVPVLKVWIEEEIAFGHTPDNDMTLVVMTGTDISQAEYIATQGFEYQGTLLCTHMWRIDRGGTLRSVVCLLSAGVTSFIDVPSVERPIGINQSCGAGILLGKLDWQLKLTMRKKEMGPMGKYWAKGRQFVATSAAKTRRRGESSAETTGLSDERIGKQELEKFRVVKDAADIDGSKQSCQCTRHTLHKPVCGGGDSGIGAHSARRSRKMENPYTHPETLDKPDSGATNASLLRATCLAIAPQTASYGF